MDTTKTGKCMLLAWSETLNLILELEVEGGILMMVNRIQRTGMGSIYITYFGQLVQLDG